MLAVTREERDLSKCDLVIRPCCGDFRPRPQQQVKMILHHAERQHIDRAILREKLKLLDDPPPAPRVA